MKDEVCCSLLNVSQSLKSISIDILLVMNKINQPLVSLLSSIYNLMPVKLDDSIYITWSFQMLNMLKSLGLEGYIDGSFPCPSQLLVANGCMEAEGTREFQEWERNDKALMTLISATLSSEALSFVVGSRNSCEVWKNLRVRYGIHSRTAAMQLQSKLYKIQKGNDTIHKYFQRIKDITDQLASVDIHIPDEEIVIIAVNGLPSEYLTIKIVVKALITTTGMSMHKLRSLLLDEEFSIDQSTKSIQKNMPSVNNTSVFYGTYDHYNTPITTYNHYNTPFTSAVHHLIGPSSCSTTHFETPRNDMISSAVISVPIATSSCQDMISPSAKFGASQTLQNSGYILDNSVAQNGGFVPASHRYYSEQVFSDNNESQQQGSLSQQQSSSSQAPNSDSKNGPAVMVAQNSINNFEVTSFHASLSHLGSVALIDAQGSPITEIRDDHEPSQSTMLDSAFQSKTNDGAKNGLSANENGIGCKPEMLSRAELSPNLVGKGCFRKQKLELPTITENVYNSMGSTTEQAQVQPQLAYGQESMELLSKIMMNCRQYYQPMQLWPSLPLIPPG